MLELRPNCECCNTDLLPTSADAKICRLNAPSASRAPTQSWAEFARIVAENWLRAPAGRKIKSPIIRRRQHGYLILRAVLLPDD